MSVPTTAPYSLERARQDLQPAFYKGVFLPSHTLNMETEASQVLDTNAFSNILIVAFNVCTVLQCWNVLYRRHHPVDVHRLLLLPTIGTRPTHSTAYTNTLRIVFLLFLNYVLICVRECGFVHVSPGVCAGQRCQIPWN